MMVSGLDPYADQTPAMAILSKVGGRLIQEVGAGWGSEGHAAPCGLRRCCWRAACLMLCVPARRTQVRAAERGDDSRLPSIPDCPEALQQLVWDCTHHSRRSRPSAAEVVRRLEALLASL